MRGGVNLQKRNLIFISMFMGIVIFSHIGNIADTQASQVVEYTPRYVTEDYVRAKQEEQKEQEQETDYLQTAIEKYQERQQDEAEKNFQEYSDEPLDGDDENPDNEISDDELLLLANCVEAEAGNQNELGKRYVCDVILNRVDDSNYPDTITSVISQEGQFSSYRDGGMDRWKPTKQTIKICKEEVQERTNDQILFFTANGYNPYGTPSFIHGDHYFSTKYNLLHNKYKQFYFDYYNNFGILPFHLHFYHCI